MSTARRRPRPPEEKPQIGKIVETGFGVIKAEFSAANLALKRLQKRQDDGFAVLNAKLDRVLELLGEQGGQIGQLMAATARHDRRLVEVTPPDKRDTVKMQAVPATPGSTNVATSPKRGRPIPR